MQVLFEVGDRVILTQDYPDGNEDLITGCTGTVMEIRGSNRDENEPWIGVYWDEAIERGHTLDHDTCPDGYGWNVPQSALMKEKEEDVDEESIACEEELFAFIGL